MTDFRDKMHRYIETEIEVLKALDLNELNDAMNAICDARNRGGVIYTFGNGGSAATASHMVCDFAKNASDMLGGRKFLVECLCDNTPTVMAVANDFGYADVFVRQLKNRLNPDDLVIAISGSGNSENVLRAVEYARQVGTPVVGITGYSGGRLRQLADFRMHVNIDDMQITEDIHMMFDHMMLKALCENLKDRNSN